MCSQEYERKVKTQPVIFPDKKRFNIDYSENLRNLITKLLDKQADSRLGSSDRDYLDIKEHAVFNSVDWDKILQKKIKPKIMPIIQKDLRK